MKKIAFQYKCVFNLLCPPPSPKQKKLNVKTIFLVCIIWHMILVGIKLQLNFGFRLESHLNAIKIYDLNEIGFFL